MVKFTCPYFSTPRVLHFLVERENFVAHQFLHFTTLMGQVLVPSPWWDKFLSHDCGDYSSQRSGISLRVSLLISFRSLPGNDVSPKSLGMRENGLSNPLQFLDAYGVSKFQNMGSRGHFPLSLVTWGKQVIHSSNGLSHTQKGKMN